MNNSLRVQIIEAIGRKMFPTSRGGATVNRLAGAALDAVLDSLTDNADEDSDGYSTCCGLHSDHAPHRHRMDCAVGSLIVALRETS